MAAALATVVWAAILCPHSLAAQPPGPPAEAIALRNTGLAQLENERPAEAEVTFQKLAELYGKDPLASANLAIAQLRQQKADDAERSITRALDSSPGRPDLIAIRAEIFAWSGRAEQALPLYREAARAAPDDVELVYALYRHAETLDSAEAQADRVWALERLSRLRPENLVVVLRLGDHSIQAGDRAEASRVYLRVRELLWQAPPVAERALEMVLEALEGDDLDAARVPAARLENVLKVTPMFKSSLTELYNGIQGIPVARFTNEGELTEWGDPVAVELVAQSLDATPTVGRALVVADLDGDQKLEVARISRGDNAEHVVEIRPLGSSESRQLAAPALDRLSAIDLDNDGFLDLFGYGSAAPMIAWRGSAEGVFTVATTDFGLADIEALALVPIDFDSEGDLDLAIARTDGTLDLYRNSLEGPLERVGADALPQLLPRQVQRLLATDLDRDGDPDLVVVHEGGVSWLDNQRQGTFVNRTAPAGLNQIGALTDAASLDLGNDGQLDLVTVGEAVQIHRPEAPGVFERTPLDAAWPGSRVLAPVDIDNDGRIDLALGGGRLGVWRGGNGSVLEPQGEDLGEITALYAEDLDDDGDVDLIAGGPEGLFRIENRGGNQNRWLRVRLRGLTTGSDKNNVFGLGASLELFAGAASQFREASAQVTHFGLGSVRCPDLLRVVWNNGVPQNRLGVCSEIDTTVVEEQVLKGSCPFLYTWNGESVSFVSDLLWGAPLGMPLAPGVWNSFDPEELVRIDGAQPRDGYYDLRITEELWETAYFDRVRLWVVDHPADVEVASSLRIVPGATEGDPRLEDRVLGSREVTPVVAAWDGAGRDVSQRVQRRDDVYADGYPVGDYQGVADRPWSLTFDLGAAPGREIRLLLDGWVFPADASLNLAVAQRDELELVLTRLEVETQDGWRPLLDPMGFPAGKTKTMVIDTPALPPGSHRLRIVTSRWLHWDRIAWTVAAEDDASRVVERLLPHSAELSYRGFSQVVRSAPNAPHTFAYEVVSERSPWLPVEGPFTRYGEVQALLEETDDRMVVLAPGDEIRLLFDARTLAPVPEGWHRTLFLESHGYDKDADRNTYRADSADPQPFRGMSGYPFAEGEHYPDTQHHRRYRAEWLTRFSTDEAPDTQP